MREFKPSRTRELAETIGVKFDDPYDIEAIWERTKNFIDTSNLRSPNQKTLMDEIKKAYESPGSAKTKAGFTDDGLRIKNLANFFPGEAVNSEEILKDLRKDNPIFIEDLGLKKHRFTKGTNISGISVGGRFVPKRIIEKTILVESKDFILIDRPKRKQKIVFL